MSPRHAIEGPAARSATLRAGFALVFVFVLVLAAAWPLASRVVAQAQADRCLVPPAVRDAVLNEVSGERAHLHVQMLAANRDRQADEYQNAFFETTYIRDMAKQAGLSRRAGGLLPFPRHLGCRGRRPVDDPADEEEDREPHDRPDLARAGQPERRRRGGGRLGRPGTRGRLRRQGRQGEDRPRQRVCRWSVCVGRQRARRRRCARHRQRRRERERRRVHPGSNRLVERRAAAGQGRLRFRALAAPVSSNCATSSTAARKSSSGRTFARARTRAR